ncbi:extracellular solute-binding protein [Achromobacter ruhlandii]|uniref:extracellular solute-binding protein n=1 Tax=Achromobacter ruhlandii TaxID=72557 RepID=UPI003B9C4938
MSCDLPRRAFLGLALAATAASLPLATARASTPVRLTVMAYGVDAFDDKYQRTVIRPFQAQYPNIQVSYYAVRDSRNALSVLRSQRLLPQIDVVILDPPNARLAQREKLIEPMDPKLVPNAADLGALGRELGFWALPAMYDSMTLVYAKSAFTQPPKSWRELWDPKYAGKVAIATNPAVNGSMIAMTMLANRLAGAPDGGGNFDAGFAYLEKLRPNVGTWNPRPNQYWLVGQNQMLLAVGWNSRSQSQLDSQPGYASTVPAEGTIAVPILIARVADRPNAQAAQAFINYSLGPQAQQAFSEAMYYAPSNRKARIGEAARARIPLLSTGTAAKLIPVDWAGFTPQHFAAMREAWLTRIMQAPRPGN